MYLIRARGKDKNRTAAQWKTSDVIVMLKCPHHVMLHLSVFRKLQEK